MLSHLRFDNVFFQLDTDQRQKNAQCVRNIITKKIQETEPSISLADSGVNPQWKSIQRNTAIAPYVIYRDHITINQFTD